MQASSGDNSAESVKSSVLDAPQRVEQLAQYLAVVCTIITLLGGAMSVLPQLAESISLGARRQRELNRVESLAELMAKIKSEDVLTADIRDSVGAQIEAEIADALEGLHVNRLKRRRPQQARTSREHPDLTVTQRAFLWYLPHGIRGWTVHTLAFSVSMSGLFLAFLGVTFSDHRMRDLPLVGTLLLCALLW